MLSWRHNPFFRTWLLAFSYLSLWILWLDWHISRQMTSQWGHLLLVAVLGVLGAAGVAGLIAAVTSAKPAAVQRRHATPLCRFCWYNLTGACSANCPECGHALAEAWFCPPLQRPLCLAPTLVTLMALALAMQTVFVSAAVWQRLGGGWQDGLAAAWLTSLHWSTGLLLLLAPLVWASWRLAEWRQADVPAG
jgi:hypothetical protein